MQWLFFCAPRMPPTPRSRTFFQNFSKFLLTTSNQIFKNDRLWRCDRFCPIFVEIGAILAIFRPFEVFGHFLFVRSSREFFRQRENFLTIRKFQKKVRVDASDSVQETSKSELSSRFLGRWKICKDSKVITKHVKCRFGGPVNF